MSSSYVRSVSHNYIDEFNKTISSAEKLISEIPTDKVRNELETKLMIAKVKKERYEALSTVSRLKTLINELDFWLTQNELANEVKCLKRSRRAADDDLQRRSKKAKKLDDINENKAPNQHDTSDKNHNTNSNKLAYEDNKPQKPSSKDQHASTQHKNNKNSYRKGELANTFTKPEDSLTMNKSKYIYKDDHNTKQIVLSQSPPCTVVPCKNGYDATNIIKIHNQSEVCKNQTEINTEDPRQLMKYFIQKNKQKKKAERKISKAFSRIKGYQERIVYENDQDICNNEIPESIEQTNIVYKEIMYNKANKLEHDARSVSSIETKKI